MILFIESLTLHFSQALTTLDIRANEIDDQGAIRIANALLENKVTSISILCFQVNH